MTVRENNCIQMRNPATWEPCKGTVSERLPSVNQDKFAVVLYAYGRIIPIVDIIVRWPVTSRFPAYVTSTSGLIFRKSLQNASHEQQIPQCGFFFKTYQQAVQMGVAGARARP